MIDSEALVPKGMSAQDAAHISGGPVPRAEDAQWLIGGTRAGKRVERTVEASSRNDALVKASKTPPIMVPHEARMIQSEAEKRADQQKAIKAYGVFTGQTADEFADRAGRK